VDRVSAAPRREATHIPVRPEQIEILVELHRLLEKVRDGRKLPQLGSKEWLDAPEDLRIAAALWLAIDATLFDRHQERRRVMAETSHDVAGHPFWRGYANRRVPYDELQRRRAVPGPMIRDGAA
jgi:hypothetical protein